MKKNIRTPKNYTIDLLRAISILYIVGYWHLFNYTSAFPGYKNVYTTWLTVIVLALFTFLAGYLIGAKEEFNSKKDLFSYYTKKVLRIYPLYLLAILLFYLLEISDFKTLLKASVFLSMFKTPAPLTLWFITMIFNFYIIAPILVKTKNNLRHLLIISITIMLIFLSYSSITGFLDYRIIVYFPAFVAGIIIATKEKFFLQLKPVFYLLLFLTTIPLILIEFDSKTLNRLMRIPFNVSGSVALYIMSRTISGQPLKKLISHISYASFTMLIFHRPVYKLLKSLYFPENPNFQIIYLIFFCLPMVLIISWLIQAGYDKLTKKMYSS